MFHHEMLRWAAPRDDFRDKRHIESKRWAAWLLCSLWLLVAGAARAQVPQIINYQGRITVDGTNFSGNGQFKFALVDGGGTVLWSNAPMSGGQPEAFVVLPVANGIYSVFLGDPLIGNMAAIPAHVFINADVRLRVWFNNGTLGFQQLAPDQRVGAVGFAIMAGSVPDGAITSAKLAAGAVTPDKLAATDSLTVTNMGELFTKTVATAEAPRTLSGTLTIDRGTTPNVSQDIVFVETPALELEINGGGLSVGKKTVGHLVARRPLTNDKFWAAWFADVAAARPGLAAATVAFANGPSVLMEGTFPSSYIIERGADGIFYETITLKPGTYEPQ